MLLILALVAPVALANDGEEGDHRGRRGHRFQQQPYGYGQFYRPFPYHLDLYRVRYGGSYSPYHSPAYLQPNPIFVYPQGFPISRGRRFHGAPVPY